MNNRWKKVLKFLTLFVVGYCLYVGIEITFRNESYRLMGMTGAIAFIIIDQINNRISWDLDLILQGCIGSLIITGFELVIGEVLKFLNSPPMWDYSNLPYNFHGVICLQFSLLWVLLSIVAVVLADAINYYVLHDETQPYYFILTRIFMLPKRSCEAK